MMPTNISMTGRKAAGAVLGLFLLVGSAVALVPVAHAQTADQLRAQRTQANREHTRQIRNIEGDILNLRRQVDAATGGKTVYEANLARHQETTGVGDWLIKNLAPDDRRENFLEGRIENAESRIRTLESQIRSLESGLGTKRAEVASYNTALDLRITQADPALRAAEEASRNAVATGITRDIETQKAQIEATMGIFERRVTGLDATIAERRRQGLNETADQLEKDKQQVITAHRAHTASMQRELDNLKDTRRSTFQQNREDGIGYTNSGMVRTGIRQAARARGEAVTDSTAQEALVDRTAVGAAVESTGRIATGAPLNQLHPNTVRDFLLDIKEDKLTWYEFSLRFGSYSKGAARGTWDALKDLLKLVKELGDTGGEATERALRAYGIDTNTFGTENLEMLDEAARQWGALVDPDNPEGAEIAKNLVDLADRVVTQAEREVEQTAASGDVHKALEGVGYVTATVLGGEEIALGGIATATRVANRLFSRARRVATQTSNMAPGHAEAFSKVARDRDEIIMVRPVNPHSTDLIARNYATKGMNIKGKSANRGEHAGTIPVDASLSKLGNRTPPPTPDELKQYNNYNKKALGEPYETPTWDDAGNITGWKPHDRIDPIADAVPLTRPDGSVVTGPDGNPVMVLANRETGAAITADYDLFAVGSKDGPGEVGPFDENLGSISERERGTMDDLNEGSQRAGYTGGNVVHHGPANRFANILEAADFPITVYTPDGNVHTLGNLDDLNDFYATWRGAGYKLEAMDGWGIDPDFVPTGKYNPVTGSRAVALAALAAAKAECEADPDCDPEDLEKGEPAEATPEPPSPEATPERPTTGVERSTTSGGGGEGGSAISVGQFNGVPSVPRMDIAFGPYIFLPPRTVLQHPPAGGIVDEPDPQKSLEALRRIRERYQTLYPSSSRKTPDFQPSEDGVRERARQEMEERLRDAELTRSRPTVGVNPCAGRAASVPAPQPCSRVMEHADPPAPVEVNPCASVTTPAPQPCQPMMERIDPPAFVAPSPR